MEQVTVRGKRAKAFGIAGFFLFGATYGLYAYSTIKAIVKLAMRSAQGNSIAGMIVASVIDLLFILGIIYLSVDGIVKYFKNHPTGAFPHTIRLIMTFVIYSFLYPIYSKFLRLINFDLLDLIRTPTGILLIVSLLFSIASFFLINKPKKIRHLIFAGVLLPMIALDILTLVWTIPGYPNYWMNDAHLTIFGPWFRLLALVLIIVGYFFEKKEVDTNKEKPEITE